ncbi:hypothetical protein AGMMS50212_15640 [Spirochaetia bacterium]|nr:hypothetical protein AGMMS50212_15640 [Spirochaetia bacterium]
MLVKVVDNDAKVYDVDVNTNVSAGDFPSTIFIVKENNFTKLFFDIRHHFDFMKRKKNKKIMICYSRNSGRISEIAIKDFQENDMGNLYSLFDTLEKNGDKKRLRFNNNIAIGKEISSKVFSRTL